MENISLIDELESIRATLLSLEHVLTRSEPLDGPSREKAINLAANMMIEVKRLRDHEEIDDGVDSSIATWPNGALHKVSLLLQLICEAIVKVKNQPIDYMSIATATGAIIEAHESLVQDLQNATR